MEVDLTKKQQKNLSKFNFFKKTETEFDKKEIRNIGLTALALGSLPFIATMFGIPILSLISSMCYVAAFFFAFKATMFLRPGTKEPLNKPIILYIVAVVLTALPSVLGYSSTVEYKRVPNYKAITLTEPIKQTDQVLSVKP